MTPLKFSIKINASKEKVWSTLWNDTTYRQWTAAFMEGSYAESDWKEGSKIVFLSPGGNGMFGVIEKMVPNEKMIFKHQGEIKDGVEETKDWAGAHESYYLDENNGVTELNVEVDSVGGEFEEYMKVAFPKALNILKEISEQ